MNTQRSNVKSAILRSGVLHLLVLVALPASSCLSLTALAWMCTSRYAILINTSNDFPEDKAYDNDAFPGQILQAYWVLRKNGYDDKQIVLMLYHGNDLFVDYDGDGKNDLEGAEVDICNTAITRLKIHHELQQAKKHVEPYGELLVYLANHGELAGSQGAALCFDSGERLYSNEFSAWLDDVFCKKTVILADFCYSGDFVKSLDRPGRVCVSSTSEGQRGWYYWDWTLEESNRQVFGRSGSVFFHPFWNKIGRGASFEEAFQFAERHYTRWKEIDSNSTEIIERQRPRAMIRERSVIENIWFEVQAFLHSIFKAFIRSVCHITYSHQHGDQ